MHKNTCLPFPSPFYWAEGLYSMRLIETSQNMQMELRARCQEPDSFPTGGLGGRWDLPSGSPLWTSGLPPCARQRSGRWRSGTESRGRCLGACLGKWKAEGYWGWPGPRGQCQTSFRTHILLNAHFNFILAQLSLNKQATYLFCFACFNYNVSLHFRKIYHRSHIIVDALQTRILPCRY